MVLLPKETISLVTAALSEDLGTGDITSRAIIPAKNQSTGILMAKEAGIICGVEIVGEVFRQAAKNLKGKIKVTVYKKDGDKVLPKDKIAKIEGSTQVLLAGERTALNFIQQLSGVATLTDKYITKISKSGAKNTKLLDTRKTVPSLRMLQKYAVKVGGGTNHRIGLYDAILIKDNHIKAVGGIVRAVILAKIAAENIKSVKGHSVMVEVEAKNLAEVSLAILEKPDRILLDNFSFAELKKAAKLCRLAKIESEASGGITLSNIGKVAKAGVDFISVGALTHSAPALDLNLKIV